MNNYEKSYYIIKNSDRSEELDNLLFFRKKISIQLLNKNKKIIDVSNLRSDILKNISIYTNGKNIFINREVKKIFDLYNIENNLTVMIETVFQNKELRYLNKFWELFLPTLTEGEFSENLINKYNGYYISELIGNYKAFKIVKNNEELQIVDEEIMIKIKNLGKKNIKFEKLF
ncbi:MAG: hypothetical protein ACRC0F_11125 [Cetobacterium sp.]